MLQSRQEKYQGQKAHKANHGTRPSNHTVGHPKLFQEIRRFIKYRHILGTAAVVINVAGNVAVFIPLGSALPVLFERIKS